MVGGRRGEETLPLGALVTGAGDWTGVVGHAEWIYIWQVKRLTALYFVSLIFICLTKIYYCCIAMLKNITRINSDRVLRLLPFVLGGCILFGAFVFLLRR